MEKLKMYWLNNQTKVSVQLIGLVFFIFYGILAILFYKERTLSFDSAAFAFELVHTKTFFTPLGRWGSVFSQILPLLFLKAGCSLATFLKVFSLNFILLYYLGFLIITTVFKNYKIGLVYLLTLCLTFRNTFYFSVSEFAQGLALVVVLYAMLEHLFTTEGKRKIIVFILSILLIASLYFFHQLLIVPITFVLLLAIIKNKEYKSWYGWGLFGFLVLWFGVKLFLLSANSYEADKIPNKTDFLEQLPNLFELPSYEYFTYFFNTQIIIASAIFVTGLVILLFQKRVLLFLLITAYTIGYLVLIVITYYKGESPNMYEQYYIVFGLFIACVIDLVWEKELSKKYLIIFMLPVLCYSSYKLYAAHELPTKRLQYLTNLVKNGQKLKNKKYIITRESFPWGYAWVTWALPVETVLLSSIENNKNTVTFYIPNEGEEPELTTKNGDLHAAPSHGWMMNTKVLDSNYFKIPTETAYLKAKSLKRNLHFIEDDIRYNIGWRKEIKKKAKKEGVSIEEMIRLDAKYVFNNFKSEEQVEVELKINE